jgi:hypothetical protein
LSLRTLREEAIIQLAFDPIMDDEEKVTLELSLLGSNIKKDVVGILDFFLTFLRSYEEKTNS